MAKFGGCDVAFFVLKCTNKIDPVNWLEKRLIMKTSMLAFVTLVAQILGAIAIDYTDLEAMGVECKGRVSCQSIEEPYDFFKRNCECDPRCTSYGDCCFDGPSGKQFSDNFLDCMPFGTVPNLGAYVISSCPLLGGSSCVENNMSDPLGTAPVSTPWGATYRNARCAECNGVDLTNLVTWTPLINCDTLAPYNLSSHFVWGGLERAADKDDEWGVWFEKQFHTCEVLFDKPESVKNVRLCRPDLVSTCPDDYRRKTVRRHCGAYTAVVYTSEAAYRNPHCAICNGVPVDKLVCDYTQLLFRRFKSKFSFALLFDVNRSDGDLVGYSQPVQCSRNQKYDPFSKKCRNLVCALRGYKIVDRKCVKV